MMCSIYFQASHSQWPLAILAECHVTPGHELRDTGGDFFPLISLSDSVPLPLTSYLLPLVLCCGQPQSPGCTCCLHSPSCHWWLFVGQLLGDHLGYIWGQPGDNLSSEVKPMKCSLLCQPWINCNTRCSEVRSNSSMQYQSSAQCMHWNAAN